MFAAFVLLMLIGLGVLKFEIDPVGWPVQSTGQFPAGSSIELGGDVDSTERPVGNHVLFLGATFWLTQLLTGLLSILLPYLRPIRASLATLLTAALILLLNYPTEPGKVGIPLEFELITILTLFSLYILLSFMGEIRDRQKLTAIFSQYVPPELVEEYSRDPNSISLEGEAREVSVLFCDIYGFTSISENLDPKTLANWLNRYFSLISQVIVDNGGTLDKYIGDSVMAFWGAPVYNQLHAAQALNAAMDMQRGVDELSKRFSAEGLPPISVGIGISTGISNVGNLGSHYRMAYTVVGDTVNIAQRLERQTRRYHVPIIVSEQTAEQSSEMLYRELDTVKVKGRVDTIRMYQPICEASLASPEILENLAAHKRAMRYLVDKDWSRAARIFESLSKSWSTDTVYQIYLKRISDLKNH